MSADLGAHPSDRAGGPSDLSQQAVSAKGAHPLRGFMLKPYAVEVCGFGAFAYPAASPGKALAQAWGDYVGCYNRATFKDFLKIARVRRTDAGERFGEPIMVGKQLAFWVGMRGQYVRFARPGETETFLSHPSDVAAIATEARRAETTGSVHEGAGRRHRPNPIISERQMTDRLKEELEDMATDLSGSSIRNGCPDCGMASNTASEALARITQLEAALKPFADCCEYIGADEDDEEWAKFRLIVKNYRDARAALHQGDRKL